MREFDLIVVGSGSGLDVAVAASQAGKSVAIIEKGPLGGTCLNRGCIPSKMLIHSADIMETLRSAHKFGINVKDFEVDFKRIVLRVKDEVDRESREIERNLRRSKNPVLYKGIGRFVDMKTIEVDGERLRAEKILIAAGSRPEVPNIPGLKESGYITSDEALRLETQPRILTILGGGYIAAELAHFFGSLGTEINIVQRRKVLLPNEDESISSHFTHIFSKKFNVLTGHAPVSVSKNNGTYEVKVENVETKEQRLIYSDQLLIAAGRTPNSDLLDLERTGVKTDSRGFIVVDEYLRTNVDGIFALGDIIGRYQFKHAANLEAEYAYHNIIHPDAMVPVDYTAIPHAVFTNPQIAGVGKTEQQLRSEGADYLIGFYRYAGTGMGKAIGDDEGFVKFLVDRKSGKILGCHILGHDASVLIHEVLVAMRCGDGTLENIRRAVHIHPALSEVVDRAAASLFEPRQ
ncbi:MAG: dihydrolipoyl dehydrogenase [Candidatus Methanomethylicaceae archaeon]|nr:dihydrolipoyl dehydrogenase [Candidatus Verstraetearchaeota archaeon]